MRSSRVAVTLRSVEVAWYAAKPYELYWPSWVSGSKASELAHCCSAGPGAGGRCVRVVEGVGERSDDHEHVLDDEQFLDHGVDEAAVDHDDQGGLG
jgi:hypothetical protein